MLQSLFTLILVGCALSTILVDSLVGWLVQVTLYDMLSDSTFFDMDENGDGFISRDGKEGVAFTLHCLSLCISLLVAVVFIRC